MRKKILYVLLSLVLSTLAPIAVAQDITIPDDLAGAPPPEQLSPALLTEQVEEGAAGQVGVLPSPAIAKSNLAIAKLDLAVAMGSVPMWVWAVVGAIALVSIGFTVAMLVHAITKPISRKPLWVVLLLLFGPIAALVYVFTGRKSAEDAYLNLAPAVTPGVVSVGMPSSSPAPTPPQPTPVVTVPAPSSFGAVQPVVFPQREEEGVKLGSVLQIAPEPVPVVPPVPPAAPAARPSAVAPVAPIVGGPQAVVPLAGPTNPEPQSGSLPPLPEPPPAATPDMADASPAPAAPPAVPSAPPTPPADTPGQIVSQ